MKRTPVNSSTIAAIGYSKPRQILEVEFISGEVYQYLGVPESIYNGIMSASSRGHYLHYQVKGIYKFRKVGD